MNILINMQSFSNESLYNEIVKISKRDEISRIYLVSALMNKLDMNTIKKYSSINKVKYIETNSLCETEYFSNEQFLQSKEFLVTQKNIYSLLLSSSRWIPISQRINNDCYSFSMTFYYDVYNYWDKFFSENHIDCIVSLQTEHSSLDSILINVAKENGILNIFTAIISGWQASINEEYFTIYDNTNDKILNLKKYKNKEEFNINYNYAEAQNHSDAYKISLFSRFTLYKDRFFMLVGSDSPVYDKFVLVQEKIFNILHSKVLLHKQLRYIQNLKKYYEKISINDIDHQEKYIYYCLHFDPEATTLPKDTIYSNQLLNIRIISSALPKGWKLYVKEHPHQLNNELYKNIFLNQLHAIDIFRSKSFYRYIKELKNVELVSLGIDHKELVKNAEYIVSNTGTVFREATQLNKRCITFSSKSIYTLLDNVYHVIDYNSCRKVFEENLKPINQDVDKLFEDYSIAVSDISRRDAILLSFIIENKLYEDKNE